MSLPSWINTQSMWHVTRSAGYSSSSCDDDVDVSATSSTAPSMLINAAPHGGRSGLNTDSLSAAAAVGGLFTESMDNRLWSQLLLSSGNEGTMQSNHGGGGGVVVVGGENFLELLNTKSLAPELFDTAYEGYPKKLSNNTYYEFTNTTAPALNHLEAHELSHYNPSMVDLSEIKMTHPSMNLATNVWSAASPNPRYSTSNLYETHSSLSQTRERGVIQHPSYTEPFNAPIDLNNSSLMGLNSSVNFNGSIAELQWSNNRNFSDLIAFNGYLKKPEVEVRASKHCMIKSSESYERKRLGYEVSSTRGDGRGSGGASVGKKRKYEESTEALLKKPKNESSSAAASELKVQVPKVKMAEKITALQQIVSPFGKTDTASVLQETIVYIKFLHEQVQLLSDPYIKSSSCKDQNLWGVERKEKEEAELELRSRGLCLVPLSCTSQVYRDNNGPDFWTLPYRSCLYR